MHLLAGPLVLVTTMKTLLPLVTFVVLCSAIYVLADGRADREENEDDDHSCKPREEKKLIECCRRGRVHGHHNDKGPKQGVCEREYHCKKYECDDHDREDEGDDDDDDDGEVYHRTSIKRTNCDQRKKMNKETCGVEGSHREPPRFDAPASKTRCVEGYLRRYSGSVRSGYVICRQGKYTKVTCPSGKLVYEGTAYRCVADVKQPTTRLWQKRKPQPSEAHTATSNDDKEANFIVGEEESVGREDIEAVTERRDATKDDSATQEMDSMINEGEGTPDVEESNLVEREDTPIEGNSITPEDKITVIIESPSIVEEQPSMALDDLRTFEDDRTTNDENSTPIEQEADIVVQDSMIIAGPSTSVGHETALSTEDFTTAQDGHNTLNLTSADDDVISVTEHSIAVENETTIVTKDTRTAQEQATMISAEDTLTLEHETSSVTTESHLTTEQEITTNTEDSTICNGEEAACADDLVTTEEQAISHRDETTTEIVEDSILTVSEGGDAAVERRRSEDWITKKLDSFKCPTAFGYFEDAETCDHFFQCSNWRPYLVACPGELHFNPAINICDYPHAVSCIR